MYNKYKRVESLKINMNLLSLLMWVTQLGFSFIFPLCFFLLLASWLQKQHGFGIWITVVLGIIGLLTTYSTVRSCMRSLRKAAQEASGQEKPRIAFNDRD